VKPRTKILVIAGSDSSGGAGIQADIKTITALGGYAMTAVTAITAQNTTGVSSIISIPPTEIKKQILFTAKDIKPNAVKIGMLHSKEVIEAVLFSLNKIKNIRIVLDPVMVAKGGAKLINNQAISILKNRLMKKVFLITPNIPEAEVIIGKKINNLDEMILAAYTLIHFGANNVLLKGGHLKGAVVHDVLVNKKELHIFKNKKLKTNNTHGTGCTLSSAIATFLGCGKPLQKSCKLGIDYVNNAIRSNLNYGKGHGPVNHLTSIILNKRFR
jgi:hydroxymethylpyrimidine/phosphomethylpyrimidine kinase